MRKLIFILAFVILYNTAHSQVSIRSTPYEPEVIANFSRLLVKPTERRKATINTIVKMFKDSLHTSTLSTRSQGLFLMRAHTEQSARMNFAKNDSLILAGNLTSMTFAVDRGFKNSTAVSYFTTFNPTVDSSCFKKYSNSFIVNIITGGTGNDQYFGGYESATSGITLYPGYAAASNLTVNNMGQGSYISKDLNDVRTGMFGSVRNLSTKFYASYNGAFVDSSTHTALTMPNRIIYLLGNNQNNVAAGITTAEIDFAYYGDGLTAIENRAIYNIYNYYTYLIDNEKTLIAFDGNSLIKSYATTIITNKATYMPNENPYLAIYDVSVAGQQMSTMLTNFYATTTPIFNINRKQKLLLYAEALLSIQYGSTGTTTAGRLVEYNDSAHLDGWKTCVFTQTAFSYETGNEALHETYRVAVNDSILASPWRYGDYVIDFRNQRYYDGVVWTNIVSPLATSLDTDGLEDNTTYFYDKVHYTTLTINHIIDQYIIPLFRKLNIR